MKFSIVILAAVLASGCSLTPTQKKIAGIAAGVLVVGAVAAHELDNGGDGRVGSSGSPTIATPNVACGRDCSI